MPEKKVNQEIDTTKFVNIDDKPFDVFIGGNLARHFEAGETQTVPVWVAQVGAKHLVDRVLQEKHGVKNSIADTPLRRSLFAQILPEMAEERAIKPLSDEDFKKQVQEELAKQKKLLESLTQKDESGAIQKLKDEIAALKMRLGRKIKVESPQ